MADLVMTAVILPVVGINGITGRVFLPTIFCKWFSILYHDILGETQNIMRAIVNIYFLCNKLSLHCPKKQNFWPKRNKLRGDHCIL